MEYVITNTNNSSYELIPLLPAPHYKLMSQATKTHGIAFKLAWDTLLLSVGYTPNEIRSVDDVIPFFRNCFIG